MRFARNDTKVCTDLKPIDKNDPDSAGTAIEYSLPDRFSNKAKVCWEYFSGSAFLFEYKDKLVITDESLYLTEHGDGNIGTPYGGPRATFDSWEEVENWLELTLDDLILDDLM